VLLDWHPRLLPWILQVKMSACAELLEVFLLSCIVGGML
jgi:hypothetical protein